MAFRVTKKAEVYDPNRGVHPRGSVIDPKLFSDGHWKMLIRDGYVEEFELQTEKPAQKPEAKRGTGRPRRSKWNVDPDSLRGLSLDQLNIRIKQVDGRRKPAQSVDEAIEILSADFEG